MVENIYSKKISRQIKSMHDGLCYVISGLDFTEGTVTKVKGNLSIFGEFIGNYYGFQITLADNFSKKFLIEPRPQGNMAFSECTLYEEEVIDRIELDYDDFIESLFDTIEIA